MNEIVKSFIENAVTTMHRTASEDVFAGKYGHISFHQVQKIEKIPTEKELREGEDLAKMLGLPVKSFVVEQCVIGDEQPRLRLTIEAGNKNNRQQALKIVDDICKDTLPNRMLDDWESIKRHLRYS